jgi:MFS family permease
VEAPAQFEVYCPAVTDDSRPPATRSPFQTVLDGLTLHPGSTRGLLRPLDHGIEKQAGIPLTRLRLVGLRWFWLDGLFSTISENFYAAFVPLLALAYGASKTQIGLLASVANGAGMIAFLPGALAAQRFARRKPLVLIGGGGLNRLMLLLLALSPFMGLEPAAMVTLVIALNGVRSFGGNFSNPGWTAMVADLVPAEIRGRYFSGRNVAMALAALIVAPLAGQIAQALNRGASRVAGYQAVLGLATTAGLIATLTYARIPEHGVRLRERVRRQGRSIVALLRENRTFGGFVVGAFFWNFALHISAPFFNPFIMTDLEGGDTAVVGIAAGAFSLATLLGQRVWGRLIDRKGNLPMLRLTGLVIPLMPAAWGVAQAPWHLYVIELFAGFSWAGYNLANFNLLLELSPERDRPSAAALYQSAVFASAVLGPLVGGVLAEAWGYRASFFASGIGRLAATLLLFALVRAVPVAARRQPA